MNTLNTRAYSQACTAFTESLQFSDIPAPALAQAKLCLLDWLGCAIQGYARKHSSPAKAYVRTMGGSSQAAMIGEKLPSSVVNAAFFNGYLGHILEMDDVDRESISHPATVVAPAALAVGEWKGKSGEDLLTAIVTGYEVMLRIGAAVTPGHYAIWHTTGTAGAFGAAMAAGKLLGLPRPQLDWALGNAGTMAAGLWQFLPDGGMSKFLHAGKAAANGVAAAYLASENFTGATRILEGEQGFFAGFARQDINPAIFEDFGTNFRTALVSIKPYPCCRHTHSAIDAANELRLAAKGAGINAVRAEAYGTALNIAGIENPSTPQEAKFSLRFCIARALLHGLLTEKDFTQETLHDPATRALMQQITLVQSPELDAMMPQNWPSRMEAEFSDGAGAKARINSPKGDPDNPVDWNSIKDKFAVMTEGILDDAGRAELAQACENLEHIDNAAALIRIINARGNFTTFM